MSTFDFACGLEHLNNFVYACPSFCNCVFRLSAIMFKHSGVAFSRKIFGIVEYFSKMFLENTIKLGSLTERNGILKPPGVKT